jgi:hypothetical protein
MNKLNYSKKNSVIMLIAILILTIGYLILNTGDITLSPIILVLAYTVIIPLAIFLGAEKKKQ